MPSTNRLVEAAMALRAEAPRGWQEFSDALQVYAAEVSLDMVRCQPDMLLRAQGMAIQANELADMAREAPRIYDKILAAKIGKRNG